MTAIDRSQPIAAIPSGALLANRSSRRELK
jgi:hypothetical protein